MSENNKETLCNFVVVPLKLLAVASTYYKTTPTDENDENVCENLMSDLVLELTSNVKTAPIFHDFMVAMSKLSMEIIDNNPKYDKFLPSFISLIPNTWNPEGDDENRQKVFEFSETFRNEMTKAYESTDNGSEPNNGTN